MFGYIRPFKPELKIREFNAYKAVYCGLCKQLGKSYGFFARLTLSYDFTFLAMLAMAVSGGEPAFETGRCCVNPLKKVRMCVDTDCEALAFSSDIAALAIYYKLADNIQDTVGVKRLGWRMLEPFARPAWKKAAKARPEADVILAEAMEAQRRMERDAPSSLDAASEPTAAAMGKLFAMLSEDADKLRVLERMGYLIGRYIYICDALDDLKKDEKSGGYNPLVVKHGGANSQAREEARLSLNLTAAEIQKDCDLLPLDFFEAEIQNIAYHGLPAGIQRILTGKENPDDRPL